LRHTEYDFLTNIVSSNKLIFLVEKLIFRILSGNEIIIADPDPAKSSRSDLIQIRHSAGSQIRGERRATGAVPDKIVDENVILVKLGPRVVPAHYSLLRVHLNKKY